MKPAHRRVYSKRKVESLFALPSGVAPRILRRELDTPPDLPLLRNVPEAPRVDYVPRSGEVKKRELPFAIRECADFKGRDYDRNAGNRFAGHLIHDPARYGKVRVLTRRPVVRPAISFGPEEEKRNQ
jgi:hypothetical protein